MAVAALGFVAVTACVGPTPPSTSTTTTTTARTGDALATVTSVLHTHDCHVPDPASYTFTIHNSPRISSETYDPQQPPPAGQPAIHVESVEVSWADTSPIGPTTLAPGGTVSFDALLPSEIPPHTVTVRFSVPSTGEHLTVSRLWFGAVGCAVPE
jgi:hypothetical protein